MLGHKYELFSQITIRSYQIKLNLTKSHVTNLGLKMFLHFQFDIDFTNQAFYLIWTVLDYPKNIDIELQDLPDAIRPLNEVKFIHHFFVKKIIKTFKDKIKSTRCSEQGVF